jgi:HlyD family secretion protein
MKTIIYLLASVIVLAACNKTKSTADASGTFEAVETIISAEASGLLKEFKAGEGQELKQGQAMGFIDTVQLYLKKKQLLSQIKSVLAQKPNIAIQVAALQTQLQNYEKEKVRFTNLVKADAATQKQLDDINAQIEVVKKQIEAQQSSLGITSQSINEQTLPLDVQIEQLNDQIAKSRIVNPINGTVLSKYTEPNEVVALGKPLYKIADLSTMTLRAYVSGNQLPLIKLNQPVKVMIDDKDGALKEYTGEITWISSKAEFTPKTIQTKDERANLVYAIKVKVKNDGFLKIGMYGEVKF